MEEFQGWVVKVTLPDDEAGGCQISQSSSGSTRSNTEALRLVAAELLMSAWEEDGRMPPEEWTELGRPWFGAEITSEASSSATVWHRERTDE